MTARTRRRRRSITRRRLEAGIAYGPAAVPGAVACRGQLLIAGEPVDARALAQVAAQWRAPTSAPHT